MSDDLVARLREGTHSPFDVRLQAADEIERLRALVKELVGMDCDEMNRLLIRADVNAARAEQAEARLQALLRMPETEQEVEAVESKTRADRVLELLCAIQGHEIVTVKVETLREIKAEREQAEARLARVRAWCEAMIAGGLDIEDEAKHAARCVLALLDGEAKP